MAKTYSIHPNSHRIDKTNFPTKDEAIARAQECARILNRGVSVYEVDPPGTNTQLKDFPKVTPPINHIAFVLPDGTVKTGKHPAIELLEKNPEDGALETYPYALGQLSKLVRTLDDIARNPVLPDSISRSAFSISDSVQNRIFESQNAAVASISSQNINNASERFQKVFQPGRVFKNPTGSRVTVSAYDTKTNKVTFISQDDMDAHTRTGAASAEVFSRILLRGDFTVDTPSNLNTQAQQPSGNFTPSLHLQPATHTRKSDESAVDGKRTLEEQLAQNQAKKHGESLLAYCMDLCRNDIYAADELATAFLDAFNPRASNVRTITAQLKAMSTFRNYELPDDWFTTAQKIALKQLTSYRPKIAYVPPVEVQRVSANSLKYAQEHGIKLPVLAKNLAARIAKGAAIEFSDLERMHLFLKNEHPQASVEFNVWGGYSARNWIASVFSELPTQAVTAE